MRSFKIIDYLTIGIIVLWAAHVWSAMPAILAPGQGGAPIVSGSWLRFWGDILGPLPFLIFAVVTVLERKQTARESGIQLGKDAGVHSVLLAAVFLFLILVGDSNLTDLRPTSGLVSLILTITTSEIMFRAMTISFIIRHFGSSKPTLAVAVIVSALLFVAVQPQLHDRLLLMTLNSLISSFLVMSGGSILIVIVMDTFTLLRGSSIPGQTAVPLLAMGIFIVMAAPVWFAEKFRLSRQVAGK